MIMICKGLVFGLRSEIGRPCDSILRVGRETCLPNSTFMTKESAYPGELLDEQ